jgi:hypothetical protein
VAAELGERRGDGDAPPTAGVDGTSVDLALSATGLWRRPASTWAALATLAARTEAAGTTGTTGPETTRSTGAETTEVTGAEAVVSAPTVSGTAVVMHLASTAVVMAPMVVMVPATGVRAEREAGEEDDGHDDHRTGDDADPRGDLAEPARIVLVRGDFGRGDIPLLRCIRRAGRNLLRRRGFGYWDGIR